MSTISTTNTRLDRREFIKAGAAASAGLTLGFHLPGVFARTGGPAKAVSNVSGATFAPNAFVRIGTDGTVTVISKHLEMGQGAFTGLATILAEELDADWSRVVVQGAPANAKLYNNFHIGELQGTGGSSSIYNSYEQLRKAGAAARSMLVAAAAQEWKVPVDAITVERGVVAHGDRKVSFGQLAQKAAAMPVPADVKLKDPKDFKLIGKDVPRKDSKAKTNGSAVFTIDVKLPGMLTAVVAHPPQYGAKVRSFDAAKAKAIKGVTDVVQIPQGVAVLAKDFWTAKRGRDALSVQWDDSGAMKTGSAEILAQYKELATKPGLPAHKVGDAEGAFASSAKKLEASFDFPFLAHAAMEPMNGVVKLDADGCEIWNGAQFQSNDQINVAKALGLKPEQVKLHMLFAGGSFGRRAAPHSDYLVEAALIAKAINGRAPVKLIWTREDDMRADYFRPMYHHVMRAGLDAGGKLVAWQHRIVGQSIFDGTVFGAFAIKNGIDASSVEGASSLPYDIVNMQVELASPKIGVPVQWWRAVGSTHTAFSTETFIDELAAAAGKDPVEFRREMLAKHPRYLGVLNLAAEKSGWGKPLPKGMARGIAVHEYTHTYVAQVAEVAMRPDGGFRVERVVCAVDCGVAVNPDVIRAQMQGGIGFALSAALHEEITLKDGRVEQGNFHDYPILRINEMPKIDVHIVASRENPSGVGEPGVPPTAPAVANALFALTGERIRSLPIRLNKAAKA
ncbi:xanthine dehydrogenase family protein molybdopterin-binding subunit [Ramlibacter sp. 2FC]|uniref:xanthine dehydrogenase family protein molybdopterin-binding subunit n=1 Tax=Ramlibacter sp. 2FC TaxID=2502188 RepID=UPI001484E76F|nr:xanthine dehydrogenase family protein molybdopterin-binding subunit [Ramlibacter sp. 2FC]